MDHIARNVERHQKDVFIDDDEGDRLVRVLHGIRMRTCLPNVAAAKMHHDLFERDSAVLPQPGIFLGLPLEPHAKVCLLGTTAAFLQQYMFITVFRYVLSCLVIFIRGPSVYDFI